LTVEFFRLEPSGCLCVLCNLFVTAKVFLPVRSSVAGGIPLFFSFLPFLWFGAEDSSEAESSAEGEKERKKGEVIVRNNPIRIHYEPLSCCYCQSVDERK
jgi:hypothetical protein